MLVSSNNSMMVSLILMIRAVEGRAALTTLPRISSGALLRATHLLVPGHVSKGVVVAPRSCTWERFGEAQVNLFANSRVLLVAYRWPVRVDSLTQVFCFFGSGPLE